MSFDQWLIFTVVWIAACIPLGPSALNCISTSATEGFSRTLWVIIGILFAALCHMTATILGAATILLANAALFQILKFIGAAYLIWMGISMWRKKDASVSVENRRPASAYRLVRRGFLISMSNPKAILAYLAVFSQFLKPDVALTEQLSFLVPTSLIILVLVYTSYAALGLGVGRVLKTARRRLIFNRGVGSIYILAGVGLAASESSSAFAPRS